MDNELDALERDVDDASGCIPVAALSGPELIKAVVAYISDWARCLGIMGVVSADKVRGERQESQCEVFDHEFVDNHPCWEDDFQGTIYLPVGDGEYLVVEYTSH